MALSSLSLGIVIKGPEGLVLAADSRITLIAQSQPNTQTPLWQVNYDNAQKVLQFGDPHSYVGAVTYGEGAIGLRSAYSLIPELEATLPQTRIPVDQFAQLMSTFFMTQWATAALPTPPAYQGPGMTFVVGGFNTGEAYGRVYVFVIPTAPIPVENHPAPDFGITWGGQREFVDRLVQGFDGRVIDLARSMFNLTPQQVSQYAQALGPLQMGLPIQTLPLQNCIDLAIFFIRTTISAQNLSVGIRGVGGPIDVATITRIRGLRFIQQKQLRGEEMH